MMVLKQQGLDTTGNIPSSGFLERMVGRITGKPVPTSIVNFHRKTFRALTTKAWHVQRIQMEKFDSEEFIFFLRIKRDLNLSQGKHRGLKHIVELFEVALNVKDSFLLIEQIELRFRGSMQQKFYKFIQQLLGKSYKPAKAIKLVRRAFKKIYKHIKTKRGRTVMKDYVQAIEIVFRHKFGIELLSLFKRSRLKYYAMLLNISKIVKTTRKKDVRDLRKLAIIVHDNRADFERLGKILELPAKLNSPNTYARMLQYVCLKHRHATAADQFQDLMKRLSDWEEPFKVLIDLRQTYATQKYQPHPELFSPIPAWDIYRRYHEHLVAYQKEMMLAADAWT